MANSETLPVQPLRDATAPDWASTPPAGREGDRRGRRRPVGELLLEEGLITREQLEAALRAQQNGSSGFPVGQILVEQGAVTQRQLGLVLDKYRKKYRIGDLLVETNAITEEQLEIALQQQKATGLRLGDVLLALNFVTELDLRRALCQQLRIPFVDLDDTAIDGNLTRVLDRDCAWQHRVIPIGRAGDRITVAMEDPTDTAVVEELETSLGCRIDVVTATSAALRRAFARVYGESPEEGPGCDPGVAEAAQEWARLGDGLAEPPEAGARASRALEARHAEAVRELAALRTAHDLLRQDLDASVSLLRGLERRDIETGAELTELQARHATVLAEHEATLQELGEQRERCRILDDERRRAVDTLEEILRRFGA